MRIFLILISAVLTCSLSAQNLVVLRHGEADNNVKKLFNSRLDTEPKVSLTDKGKEQIVQAAQSLKEKGYNDKNVSLIFFSPLNRTKQTAQIVADELQISEKKLKSESLIIEGDMGHLEGKTEPEGKQYFPDGDSWNKALAHQYGGENNEDIQKRVKAFLEKVRKMHPKADVIVIGHGTPSKMLLDLVEAGAQKDEHRLKNAEFRIVPLYPKN